mmetsp:Transcript_38556/g.109364  ORF Transcript_38556/g.109364 Transcript_38556/m.109364 type:complete len:103 (+) Transcript_38556:832-1140(+)
MCRGRLRRKRSEFSRPNFGGATTARRSQWSLSMFIVVVVIIFFLLYEFAQHFLFDPRGNFGKVFFPKEMRLGGHLHSLATFFLSPGTIFEPHVSFQIRVARH